MSFFIRDEYDDLRCSFFEINLIERKYHFTELGLGLGYNFVYKILIWSGRQDNVGQF